MAKSATAPGVERAVFAKFSNLILLYMLSLISRPYRPDFANAPRILASKNASQLVCRCILQGEKRAGYPFCAKFAAPGPGAHKEDAWQI